jgi:putative flippase GtrA
MPHEIVQAVAIVVVAVLMFLLQKYWVFSNKPGKTERLLKESTT